MSSRLLLPAGFLVVTVVLIGAACSTEPNGSKSSSTQSSAPLSNPRLLAADLPLLPPLTGAVRPLAMLRTAFEFAARHPEVMHYVPCFCGCERMGHSNNHDCFVSSRNPAGNVTGWEPHGVICEICIDVANQTAQMFNSGAPISAIREAIEKKYADRSAAGLHTPTSAAPKRGGTSQH